MVRGRLVVFEGVEGAGKSTQLDRLQGLLVRAGVSHRAFREPGGTPLGDEIRRVLLDPASRMTARAEALLFMASRAELVGREVRPALAAGHVVLLDRFFLSTYAYQVGGRGLPAADVEAANFVATEGLVPDLTLLLTLGAGEGLARASRRGVRDRMEQADDAFHAAVEGAFAEFATAGWQRAHAECGPIVAVDATGSATDVESRVLDAVMGQFAELQSMAALRARSSELHSSIGAVA
ncbi:MAG: dTMP kinase [Gemmatimonadales bacterium]